MKRKTTNVLITGVGTATAQSVIKGLKAQTQYPLKLVGTDINQSHEIAGSKFCDTFYTVPLAKERTAYIQALKRIIKKERIRILIPIVDTEILVLAELKNPLPVCVLLSNRQTVRICSDKFKTYQFFRKNHIPTLTTIALSNKTDIIPALRKAKIKYPFIAKPRTGFGGKNIWQINSSKELSLLTRISSAILQEKAYGNEYTIDVMADKGKLICAVPRLRVEIKDGVSYKGRTVHDPQLIHFAEKIVSLLNIHGPANIQCFKERNVYKFSEVNPRFSGGLALTIAAGINTPKLALDLCLGKLIRPISKFRKIRMCRYWEEVFYNE